MRVSIARGVALARGFKLFISTPQTAAVLPPTLSGNRRKKFGFKTVTIHAWSKLVKKPIPKHSALSTEALGEYIGRLDDLIDQLHAPPLTNKLFYRSNPLVREHISNFVHGIKNDASLSRAQRREIFKLVGRFRKDSWRTLEHYEKKPLTLQEVLQMKEATSGGYGRLFSAILNIASDVPKTARVQVEKAFSNMAMAVQVYDDLTDFHADYQQNVPNIVMAALQAEPQELNLALRRPTLRPIWLRKNCPNAYRRIRTIFDYYVSRIPARTVPEQAFQAFPRILWQLSQLRPTSRPGS